MAEETDSLIVGADKGALDLEGDLKGKKWYARMVTGGPQQIGLIIVFVMMVITFWYFRTYGWSGVIAPQKWQKLKATQYNAPSSAKPKEIPMSHTWSDTTYRNTNDRWRFWTDPKSAVLLARNPKLPHVSPVVLKGTTSLPKDWDQIQWCLAPEDRSGTPVRLYIEIKR